MGSDHFLLDVFTYSNANAMQRQAKNTKMCLSRLYKKPQVPLPDGFYIQEISFPPGIANIASNCYASSVLQCLFSHIDLSMPPIAGMLQAGENSIKACCASDCCIALIFESVMSYYYAPLCMSS